MNPLEQAKFFPSPKSDEEGVINPTSEDFAVKFDINEDHNPQLFTARAYTITYFPTAAASHVREHLAKHILLSRLQIPVNWQEALTDQIKELTP